MKKLWSQYCLEYLSLHGGEEIDAEALMRSASNFANNMTEINYEPIEHEDENTESN